MEEVQYSKLRISLNMARDFPIATRFRSVVGPIHHVSPYRRLVLLYNSDRTRQRTDDDQTTSERWVQALLVIFSDLSLLASLRLSFLCSVRCADEIVMLQRNKWMWFPHCPARQFQADHEHNPDFS